MATIQCCIFEGPYTGGRYYCSDCDASPEDCAQERCECSALIEIGSIQPQLPLEGTP